MLTLNKINQAYKRLKNVSYLTPLIYCKMLSEKYKSNIFLKAESLQISGSFKYRGAYNKILQIVEKQQNQEVVAWSSGNHAYAVAMAANKLGIKAHVIMPKDAPSIKLKNTKSQGALITTFNRETENREAIGIKLAKKYNAVIVPPYDDIQIMAGQGTIGIEVINQLKSLQLEPDLILVPTGGGGLLSGIATAIKSKIPNVDIRGVEPEKFNDTALSIQKGYRIFNKNLSAFTICDSLRAPTPGKITFEVNKNLTGPGLIAKDKEVFKAMRYAYLELKLVLEPGGAIALASILNESISISGKTVIVIASGGNVGPETFSLAIKN